MLLLGHTGLTLAAALLLNTAMSRIRTLDDPAGKSRSSPEVSSEAGSAREHRALTPGANWLVTLGRRIDIRVLFVGSLLPDIADKLIGQFLFRDALSNGRIFCHSLLFLLLVGLLGSYLYQSHRIKSLLVLSFGILTHLVFDQMWREPRTFLWPLIGFAFEKLDLSGWLPGILYNLYTDPGTYLTEVAGMMVLAWFVLTLVRRRTIVAFITRGGC